MVMKFGILQKSFIFLFLAIVFLFANNVAAQEAVQQEAAIQEVGAPINQFSKPLPEIPYFNPKTFEENTTVYKKRPYDDNILAYKVNIPKGWELAEEKGSSNVVTSNTLFMEMNKYFGPPRIEGRSRLEISAVNMDYDYTAEQWYIKYILESGYTVEGMKVYSDRKVESLMVTMEGDFSYYLRTLAFINGKKVILVKYYLPSAYWEEEAPMQASILKSFELVNEKVEEIGEYQKFQFLDVAELQYPITWYAAAPTMRSVERMSARFLNIRSSARDQEGNIDLSKNNTSNFSDGHVDVSIVSTSAATSLISEVQNYKKELEATGIIVGKKLDIDTKLKYHENINFSISEVYEGIDSSSDFISYELWFSMFVAGNYYYFVTLLTPSQKQNYVAWAKNVRGYQEIVTSVVPTTGAYLER